MYHEYGIGMDMAKNNGVAFSIWDGPHDVHATLKANAKPGFTYLIASCQISMHLIHKVRKYLLNNCGNHLGGLNKQLKRMKK